MSVAAIRLAWRAPLDSGSKLALIALCDHADDDGICWPSMDRIAAMLGRTRSQAQRSVHALIAAGLVQVVGNASGGRGCSRRYRIELDRLAAMPDPTDRTPAAERAAPVRRFPDPERVASVREKGRTDAQKGRMDASKGPHGCGTKHQEASMKHQEPRTRTQARERTQARTREAHGLSLKSVTAKDPLRGVIPGWWNTEAATTATAQALGMHARGGESWPEFRARIHAEINRRKADQ